jgi:dTDP-4-amino-4,6-dideoxygalactose transaminase
LKVEGDPPFAFLAPLAVRVFTAKSAKGAKMFCGGVSEELFDRGLCLPSGTAMTETDLRRVVDAVRFVTQRR